MMRMRHEAKMGLQRMEEMGQMGNADEATIPDDIPFDINDLDTEDEPEYNVGGFVTAYNLRNSSLVSQDILLLNSQQQAVVRPITSLTIRSLL